MREARQAPRAPVSRGLDADHLIEEEALPRASVEIEDSDQVALILPRVRTLHGTGGHEIRVARRAHGAERAILLLEGDEGGAVREDGEGGGGVEGHGLVPLFRSSRIA